MEETIKRLKHQAKLKRDAAIRQAKREHAETVATINTIGRQLCAPPKPKRRESAAKVAERILREEGPLTVTEIAVHARLRNFRLDASPKLLCENFRTAMRYHREVFLWDGKRWRAHS